MGIERAFRPARKAHPAFMVAGLPGRRERLQARGIAAEEDVPLQGRKRVHIHDPFGNRLELIEPLDGDR